ncbi:hypothetical protein PSN45_000808 [Yamadazyma tenuis]|uniref:Class I glutamine amidotransferase-like protein n=1 Tax=Candida tenuis (strain ATCC 10573 / BCRC 21748 / CBS 615 / JCM 9827 / NBRC 10315 / NRRL Y-1498 / VKM Y-70) TaxID=590646 RepID=G3BAS3_CANTC|nr:class I glutamine amidotransferase-like protein [Yamadazyma tenuis ATCC 10573]EGV62097.1 class I glutamine amidotransferase-like protein [Yamadazyma tenuis ATCC 10573]WEJ93345.1 hypothetical protein PSN45_000808 [Yamadazyma tenuis]
MTTDSVEPHIAVLLCNRRDSRLVDKYGDLGDLCCQLVQNSGVSKFPGKKYTVYRESDDPNEDSIELSRVYLELVERIEKKLVKGIIISGSVSDSFDTKLWIQRLDEFLRTVVFSIPNFPLVGICFGHQIICKNLGCKVDRNLPEVGWECGINTISLNPEIFSIENNGFLDILKDKEIGVINDHLNLPEIHRDIVYGLPAAQNSYIKGTNFVSIGSSPKCSIQGVVTASGPLRVLTFQGHPEFSTEFTLELLKDMYEKGTIEKPVFEKSCYNTQILNNQGHLIAKLICNFINSYN